MIAEAPSGRRAEFIRTDYPFSAKPLSLESSDHAEFMDQAAKLGLRGFLPVPIGYKGKTYNAWHLESRKLKEAAERKSNNLTVQ